jgi:hypothetical protein
MRAIAEMRNKNQSLQHSFPNFQEKAMQRINARILGHFLRTLVILFFVMMGCVSLTAAPAADVVIFPSQTYQTIEGWGNGAGELIGGQLLANYFQLGKPIADPVNYQLIDFMADDLGLTGTRLLEVGTRSDQRGNDHGDPDSIDWTLFEPGDVVPISGPYMGYFARRVKAQGVQPSFYTMDGYQAMGIIGKPWVYDNPAERILMLWSGVSYYKSAYGIDINYVPLKCEPQNADPYSDVYTTPRMADMLKAGGPRFQAHGLATLFQYAEGVSPSSDWSMLAPVVNDPDIWRYVGRLSYHHYRKGFDPYRSYIRYFGKWKGIRTGQTEQTPINVNDLYDDLTLGGVSYWEVGDVTGDILDANDGQTTFTPSGNYFAFRQVLHYVRPGATRIGAVSSDPRLRVLAFTAKGTDIVVFWNNKGAPAQTVNLSGLIPGTYGLSLTPLASDALHSVGPSFQEQGVQTVGAAGTLSLQLAANTVATLYPRPSSNLPPTIMTWRAKPGYLVSPASMTTLSVTASDPDNDKLTYAWSVVSQPSGAHAALETPSAASTVATGLSAAGMYVFNVDVMDGTHTVSTKVYVVAYNANPAPQISVGFRIDPPYGISMDYPGTPPRHAYVTLPVPHLTLQAKYNDLPGHALTGEWTLVSQPAGASVVIGKTYERYASFRAEPTGLTAVGDYVFQVVVSDKTDPSLSVTQQETLTVAPENHPPSINSIFASGYDLTLPVSSTQLAAVTTDPDGDLLRHWWVVKTAPAGAKPVFDHQGLAVTAVSNLLLPGTYTFTLRCFDDLHEVTKDVTVTVNPQPGAPVFNSAAAASVIAGTPFTYTLAASGNPNTLSATNLPEGLSFDPASGVISGTPKFIGGFDIPLSATNPSGTGYGNLTLTVQVPAPVFINSANADGLVDKPFSYTIIATNIATSYSATGLPAGLTLDPLTGTISGTPTGAGNFAVTTQATNSTGTTTGKLTIVIYKGAPAVPAITSASRAFGKVGSSFNYAITAKNTPTGFFAIGLPAGLSFDPYSGEITGTPQSSGTFRVTLRASNSGGTGSSHLALNIRPR